MLSFGTSMSEAGCSHSLTGGKAVAEVEGYLAE